MGETLVVWSQAEEDRVKKLFFDTIGGAQVSERTAIRDITTDVIPLSKDIKVEPLKILAILKWVQGPG